ncbi:hypothetical protein QBC32DRAFT_350389 [Pseudoneurospora amorphoporcata]|uniref:Uncharacterized protein n=1 Tax=Pseudoneurospora amorphoporcata TaxID=241081 RepID=A0AAN6NQ16_9PEZI|nr:hypothetical protein QBC32DRAFT_350389 [Pseudoneurospora amorphoporcata]
MSVQSVHKEMSTSLSTRSQQVPRPDYINTFLHRHTAYYPKSHINFQPWRYNNMETESLITRPLRLRHRIDLRRVWDITYPFLVAIYVTVIAVLSISGVRAATSKGRLSDHPPAGTGDAISIIQEAYQALQCHSQHQTATLLSLSPAGLLGADQIFAGNIMLGLGKLLMGTSALLTWAAFWTIDKEKYPLWAMDLLSLTGALTAVWLSWGGFDALMWLVGGVYGVFGCQS